MGQQEFAVLGRCRPLVVVEQLLAELFAGPESDIFDLDVLAGTLPSEDHLFSQVADLDRIAVNTKISALADRGRCMISGKLRVSS